jgi:hypothetical protein
MRRSKECVHSERSLVTQWFTKDMCSATRHHWSVLKAVPSRHSNFGNFWVALCMCLCVCVCACICVCVCVCVCMYVFF